MNARAAATGGVARYVKGGKKRQQRKGSRALYQHDYNTDGINGMKGFYLDCKENVVKAASKELALAMGGGTAAAGVGAGAVGDSSAS